MNKRRIKRYPEHRDPFPQSTASAPYNFIPLPETVVLAVNEASELPDHDRYQQEGYNTGFFDVILTTKSPLYIRCPFTVDEILKREEDEEKGFRDQVRNIPNFFYTQHSNSPVIPGSSLRGMLRSVLEIVSYGKVKWVTDKQLFFRTVDNTAVGRYYTSRMTGKVEAGFLRRKGKNYVIEVCQYARINRNKLKGGSLYHGRGPNQTPHWYKQWRKVWVKLSDDAQAVQDLSYSKRSDWNEGLLVISGNMPNKKKEFVFLLPVKDSEKIPVPERLLEGFHDDNQITQWQRQAFPKHMPDRNCRERDGMVRKTPISPGDPVFFLREEGKLSFFGRAQMFRLPYRKSPLDLVPPELRRPEDIDYAEALFGFVRTDKELEDMAPKPKQGEKSRAYAGRVFVTDGVLAQNPTDVWLTKEAIVPKILASPKPTAFQHYLVQTESKKDKLKHYDSETPKETVIRGHKRYWLQGKRTIDDIKAKGGIPDHSKQYTQFQPVKPGVTFKFRIYFENLSDRELGALCWVLHPRGLEGREYCHQLGMGKPLGMGAVKLEATLHLFDRIKRYSTLFAGNRWELGATDAAQTLSNDTTLRQLTEQFEQHVVNAVNPAKTKKNLHELKRIKMMLKLMEWPGFPPVEKGPCFLTKENRPNTRYMIIKPNEYQNRPVLPSPSGFDSSLKESE